VRLALGYASVLVAAFVALYDKHYGFSAAYNITAVCLVIYTILSGAYFYWVRFVERGVVYTGFNAAGTTIKVYTEVPDKYTPTYKIRIETVQGNNKTSSNAAQASFTQWFGRNGLIVYEKFDAWVVETLNGNNGDAESKKAK
jgi:hypothetical protein